MNRTIRQITDNLTGLLPDNRQYYKPEELRSWGFPTFIVRRIQVELKRNLAESMRLPETDWANMQSNTVQDIWQQFIGAIRNEAWLPASYAQTVIETAVADVLEILIQPRKNIPEVIFGADEKLTDEQVDERVQVLVVYSHFANLLPRYMRKKGIQELNKERCIDIIEKADKKIINRYTPLNWAQMLEPLFTLSGGQVESSLLRLFFEDKNMPKIARAFDLMDQSVNRARLIETLSSPESINVQGFEEEQSGLFDHEASPAEIQTPNGGDDPEGEEQPYTETKEKSIADSWVDEDQNIEEEPEAPEDTLQENEVVPLSNKSRESQVEIQHEEPSLNTDFEDDEAEEESVSEPDNEEDFSEESGHSLNENFENPETETHSNGIDAGVQEEELSDEVEFEAEETVAEEADDLSGEEVEIKEPEKEETPMWQRFMSTEEQDKFNSPEEEESTNDGFAEEPVFDVTADDEPDEHKLSELQNILENDKSYFVEEIFKGSERAYNEALEEIASKKDWRSASRYIEKEVFKRNFIDLYSEEAVEFTDRLHNYFIDNPES